MVFIIELRKCINIRKTQNCCRKDIWHKNILGSKAYSWSRLCGCCRPASAHAVSGFNEKGPDINQRPHPIQNNTSIKEVWVLVLGFFVFLSAVSPNYSLVSEPRGRLGGPRGKTGSACEKFEDNECDIFDQCFWQSLCRLTRDNPGRVLSLSDCRYSLNPLSQTRIDWVGRYRIRWTFKLSYA